MDNLAAIAKDAPQLKYVQLDDGYQPAMGDWLETGRAFGGDIGRWKELLGILRGKPTIPFWRRLWGISYS